MRIKYHHKSQLTWLQMHDFWRLKQIIEQAKTWISNLPEGLGCSLASVVTSCPSTTVKSRIEPSTQPTQTSSPSTDNDKVLTRELNFWTFWTRKLSALIKASEPSLPPEIMRLYFSETISAETPEFSSDSSKYCVGSTVCLFSFYQKPTETQFCTFR